MRRGPRLQGEGHPVGVHTQAPVQVTPGQAVDGRLGGGHVGSHGDGVLIAQAGDIQHILVHLVVLGELKKSTMSISL